MNNFSVGHFACQAKNDEDGELFFHVWASLYRVIVCYFWGCVLGIIVGVAIGLSKLLNDYLDPPMQFVRNITPVAIVANRCEKVIYFTMMSK